MIIRKVDVKESKSLYEEQKRQLKDVELKAKPEYNRNPLTEGDPRSIYTSTNIRKVLKKHFFAILWIKIKKKLLFRKPLFPLNINTLWIESISYLMIETRRRKPLI